MPHLRGKIYADYLNATNLLAGGVTVPVFPGSKFYVDGTNGSDTTGNGRVDKPYATIQTAIDAASDGDTIYIRPIAEAAGDTDPGSYAENLTIAATKSNLRLVGLSNGVAQGGQPQLRKGAGSSPHITVEAFGCFIHGLTINGASNTGGGIKLVAAAGTKDAGGLVISDCHFKNLKSSAAAATGGAIYWTASGGCWYVTIVNCEFFDCRAGIVLMGTGIDRPKGIKILNCRFFSSANTTVDADIYLSGGDGVNGLMIDRCVFGTVDVPGYATSPSAARYLDLTGCTNGVLSNSVFACSGKTFGAAGNAAKVPTTVRMAACWQEDAAVSRA